MSEEVNRYRGRLLTELTKEELIEALKAMHKYYQRVLKVNENIIGALK